MLHRPLQSGDLLADERELIDLLRNLDTPDRAAVVHLLRSLAGERHAPSLH